MDYKARVVDSQVRVSSAVLYSPKKICKAEIYLGLTPDTFSSLTECVIFAEYLDMSVANVTEFQDVSVFLALLNQVSIQIKLI